MKKNIILVHGRSWKPTEAELKPIWKEVLRFWIERDHPGKLDAYDDTMISFVYYGDLSNKTLLKKGRKKPPNSTAARMKVLEELKCIPGTGFTKRAYNKVPGKESFKEGAADSLAPVLSFFHLTDKLIEKVAPDMSD